MTDAMTVIPSIPDLVAIEEGKITKSMALRAAGATVITLGLDTGQELTEHKTTTPVLVQVIRGRLQVTTAAKEVELTTSGLVHFPALLPHAVKALEPTVMTITLLTSSGSAPTPPPGPTPLVLEDGPPV